MSDFDRSLGKWIPSSFNFEERLIKTDLQNQLAKTVLSATVQKFISLLNTKHITLCAWAFTYYHHTY